MSIRKFLESVQKESGVSGERIAEDHLDVVSQNYYKWKDQRAFDFEKLVKLAELPNMSPEKLGRLLCDSFKRPHRKTTRKQSTTKTSERKAKRPSR